MFAHNPLHGSGQAGFPHPALALGEDAHAAERIAMTDGRQRQPASDEAPHAVPEYATVLAAPRPRAMPEPSHLESKKSQRRVVPGHSVIPDVATHHRLQPLALFGDGFVHTTLKFGFHLIQLRLQSLAYRLPQHREPSITPLLYADMRKAKEVAGLRFPFSTPLPHVPLSTLRRCSCKQLRMTRGRCGSLLHIRMTFAFTTPRRFSRCTGEWKWQQANSRMTLSRGKSISQ
jgi:hypothetical protein